MPSETSLLVYSKSCTTKVEREVLLRKSGGGRWAARFGSVTEGMDDVKAIAGSQSGKTSKDVGIAVCGQL